MQPTIDKLDTNALFTQYVDIVNRAIGEHRDEAPFQQLLSMGEKIMGDRKVGAAVYQKDPSEPHDYFTLRFEAGKLRAEHGKNAPDISWKVKEDYLRKVVAEPETYVKHPTKLDLDWLESRLGL